MVENALVSYRLALEAPLHRNLSDVILPGVLAHCDTPELMEAIGPRRVVLVLGTPERIRIVRRGFRDPLPIE